jgi:hypothetical protein
MTVLTTDVTGILWEQGIGISCTVSFERANWCAIVDLTGELKLSTEGTTFFHVMEVKRCCHCDDRFPAGWTFGDVGCITLLATGAFPAHVLCGA